MLSRSRPRREPAAAAALDLGPSRTRRRGGARQAILTGDGDAQAGGGRLLRQRHPRDALRRSANRHAPGAGGNALEQAVLRLRRRRLADRPRHRAVHPRERSRPQLRLVAHGERRGHFDARQVGVSLVRGLGSGLSRGAAHARRSRLRQEAAPVASARALHAPERAGSGLRVELRRREPTGSRLGRLSPLSAGSSSRRGVATSSFSRASTTSC